MNPEAAVEILRQLITLSLTVIGPIAGVAIGLGVVVSLFQAVTSIQEQTLSFMPKLVGIGMLLMVSAPWMLRHLMEFTTFFLSRLPEMTK
jgi:flagellar biosynthetic protein FliQ